MKKRSRRACRLGAWIAACLTAVAIGALAWSLVAPIAQSRGRYAFSITRGVVELAQGGQPVERLADGWRMRAPTAVGYVLLAPGSTWRPTTGRATIGAQAPGMPAGGLTIRVLYIPLWPWVALLSGISVLLWWRTRRIAIPGHCAACGYDLRSLPGPRCPECGRSMIRAILHLLFARRHAAPA